MTRIKKVMSVCVVREKLGAEETCLLSICFPSKLSLKMPLNLIEARDVLKILPSTFWKQLGKK